MRSILLFRPKVSQQLAIKREILRTLIGVFGIALLRHYANDSSPIDRIDAYLFPAITK